MKIVFDYPPNIDEIRKVFTLRPTVVFTYDDTIYNPGRGTIDSALMIHEATHSRQQGDDPAGWWKKYLSDPKFRLDQEVYAYRNQYRNFAKTCRDRNTVALFLHRIASDLSSQLYGGIVGYQEAVRLIKGGV
jgi:hypothetical protein